MDDPVLGGAQDGFNQKWNATSHHESTNPAVSSVQASQIILEALKNKKRTATAEWLSGLKAEIPVSGKSNPSTSYNGLASVSKAGSSQAPTESTMIGQAIHWLDKMFVEFELYAADFNLNVRGTNLVVSCTRPIKRTNDTGGLYSEAGDDCLSYAGHIATQQWSLVVRGCATKIEMFIIPAELLIAFSISSTNESGHEPLLVLEPGWRDNEIIWHVQNHIITTEQIPALAKELFGDLLKVASGQMTEAELIANPIQTISANDNAVIAPPVPTTPKPTPAPLIEQLVNPNVPPSVPVSTPTPLNTQAINLPNNESKVSPLSLESLRAADHLLILIDTDINRLMESAKKALEVDDTAAFEQVKDITTKLEALKNSLSDALSRIH